MTDLLEARKKWYEKFTECTGIPTPTDLEGFPSKAQGFLSQYKNLIDYHVGQYDTLTRLVAQLQDPVVVRDIPFTEGQQKAYDSICAWLKTREPYYVLRGFAGTGKTTLVSKIASGLSTSTTLFTAPTNKATKVLKTLLRRHQCRTIYSALSLKMVQREDELVLEASDDRFNLNGFKLIVIDEASMLNSELMKYVDEAQRHFGIKILFVLDGAQIPPVGEDRSPVLDLESPFSALTEVVRHDNQILEIATHIRRSITRHKKLAPVVLKPDVEKCVWQLSGMGFRERVRRAAKSGFKDMKVIAWRNATVDRYNDLIRQELYAPEELESSMWLPGDQIVVTEPIGEGNQVIATTDDEGIVVSSSIGDDPESGLQCYFVNLKMETGTTLRVRVIHESAENAFRAQLADLAAAARQPGQQKMWRNFWALRNRFNSIRHSYAITAHRSQGSTFKYVFVDAGDILANTDRDTAYRCLYVGCTRPSMRLYITGFPK